MFGRGRHALHIVLIVIAVCALYAHTLTYPFQFDDEQNITRNRGIESLGLMYASPQELDSAGVMRVFYHHFRVRALPYLSFWANYATGGKQAVWQWRAVNVGLHAAMCCLVYLFAITLFKMPRLARALSTERVDGLAFVSAMLYAAHPLQTETVVYVSGRVGQIAAVFYLASLVAYLAWRTGGRGGWLALSLLSAVCAMFSKETAFTIPLMIALIELIAGDGLKRWRGVALFLCLLPVMPVTKLLIQHLGGISEGVTSLGAEVTRGQYLLTQPGVLVRYLRLIFFPEGQCADYDWPPVSSAADPRVLGPLALLILFAASGAMALRAGRLRADLRVAALGVFAFFLALSIESSVFPIAVLIAEYRTYLPMAFLLPGITVAAAALMDKINFNKGARIALVALAVAALGAATVERSHVWRTQVSLWEDVLSNNPGHYRAVANLGAAYEEAGDYEKALQAALKVLGKLPDYAKSLYNVASAYSDLRMWEAASVYYDEAAARDPALLTDPVFLADRAGNYAGLGRWGLALKDYQSVLSVYPEDAGALQGAGECMERLGDHAGALRAYEAVIRQGGASALAHVNMAMALDALGRKDEAEEHLNIALSGRPVPLSAVFAVSDYWRKRSRADKAMEALNKGLADYPGDERIRSRLDAIGTLPRE